MRHQPTIEEKDPCQKRIELLYETLSNTSKRVADFILSNQRDAIYMTVAQLAESTAVSEASVVRFCRNLRYSSFNEFKINLASEIDLGGQMIFEDVSVADHEGTVLDKVFSSEIQALQDTSKAIDRNAFIKAVNAIAFSNMIEFYACGNANPIIQDAHYRFLRIGLNSRIGIDSYDSLIHASMLRKGDVAIAVSHSGSTKHTIKMLQEAKKSGALTICITGFEKSPITHDADINLVSTSKETMFRSVAMASRIVQMAIMDALVVAVAFKRFEQSKIAINQSDKILAEDKI